MAHAATSPKYALISPTFKRPDEVTEFLQSLTALDYPQSGFEIILGDGTPGDDIATRIGPLSRTNYRFRFITRNTCPSLMPATALPP